MARTKRTDPDGRMPLREHLLELRKRLFLAAVGLAVGAVAGWFLYQPVFELLQQPLLDSAAGRDGRVSVNFAGLASAFDMQIKVSLFLAVFVTSPWWLYQLWAFITPGLTRREKRSAVGFLLAAVPLFLAGAALAAWTLPTAVKVLTDFTPEGASNFIDAQSYLSFVMRFVLAFGLAFVLPVIMVCINLVGLVRAETWARGWRWAVLLAFVFAAVMTPTPDAITMIVMALPICGLYFAALGLCVLHDRRADKRLAAARGTSADGTSTDGADGTLAR